MVIFYERISQAVITDLVNMDPGYHDPNVKKLESMVKLETLHSKLPDMMALRVSDPSFPAARRPQPPPPGSSMPAAAPGRD